MKMDANTEQRVSDARAKHRQDKKTPFLIRDDGMLYPNTPLMRRNQRFRPYYGDVKASLADRMRFLAGLAARREVVYNPEPEAPFDIGTASVDDLLNFAVEQFGRVLDPSKPVKKLREEVFALSQMGDALPGSESPSDELSGGGGDDHDAPTTAAGGVSGGALGLLSAAAIPTGQAIESAAPLRGGRQPRGANVGRQRDAGTSVQTAP